MLSFRYPLDRFQPPWLFVLPTWRLVCELTMFYYNAKYAFALPGQAPAAIAGGIIAASAMPAGQLVRRDFRKYPYLQHRLFDPQLYLSSLDPNVATKSVVNLASWPWFCPGAVPEDDSDRHTSVKNWKDLHADALLRSWPNCVPNDPQRIGAAAKAAVKTQLQLGCEMIILPGPLTTIATQQYATETTWIDAGLEACKALKEGIPIWQLSPFPTASCGAWTRLRTRYSRRSRINSAPGETCRRLHSSRTGV